MTIGTDLDALLADFDRRLSEHTHPVHDHPFAPINHSHGTVPPPVDPEPVPGTSRTVKTIAELLSAAPDDAIDELLLRDGSHLVASASLRKPNSLWLGEAIAARTRPLVIRPETPGGVLLDGGGATHWIAVSFAQGVHDLTWGDFAYGNAEPTNTGVIMLGDYGITQTAAPHHITLKKPRLLKSLRGRNDLNDHGVYFSHALDGGPHDITIDDFDLEPGGTLSSAFHFYHSVAPRENAKDVLIRRFRIGAGVATGIFLWDETLRNIRFQDGTIDGARNHAVSYGKVASGIVFERVISTRSGVAGLYAPSKTGLSLVGGTDLK